MLVEKWDRNFRFNFLLSKRVLLNEQFLSSTIKEFFLQKVSLFVAFLTQVRVCVCVREEIRVCLWESEKVKCYQLKRSKNYRYEASDAWPCLPAVQMPCHTWNTCKVLRLETGRQKGGKVGGGLLLMVLKSLFANGYGRRVEKKQNVSH